MVAREVWFWFFRAKEVNEPEHVAKPETDNFRIARRLGRNESLGGAPHECAIRIRGDYEGL